jgi:SAM-dependent methyltransferase
MPERPKPSKQRRALSARGGPVTAEGEPALAALLAGALESVPVGDADPEKEARTQSGAPDEASDLTHGFHSFPARFSPLLPRRLLAGVTPGQVVLDPFAGSGTALVEAMLRGARVFGSDVNPLAIELCKLKATPWPADRRDKLAARASEIAAASLARVKKRARTKESGRRYDDPSHYAPHVFRELVGLREELEPERDPELRRALLLLFSSILVKVSRQSADTAPGEVERAIGKGLPTRLFQRKAEELSRRLAAFAARVPPGTPPPDVRACDARALRHLAAGAVDVIVTSPPYLGTYDYAAQHERRYGWLGLDARPFAAQEIGARRRAGSPASALETWQKDVDAFVAEMARVLRPGGRAFVAIGDSALGAQLVPGDQALRRAAARAKLKVPASASQARPSFYRPAARLTRREHLILLVR